MAEATNTTTLNEKDFSFRFKRLPHYKSIQDFDCSCCTLSFKRVFPHKKSEEGLKPIICYGCSQITHKYCYGLETITKLEDDIEYFVCDVCKEGNKKHHECDICKSTQGLMKNLKDGGFIHPVCGFTHPEVNIMSYMRIQFKKAPFYVEVFSECQICKKGNGYMKCSQQKCSQRVHPLCVMKASRQKERVSGDEIKDCWRFFISAGQNKLYEGQGAQDVEKQINDFVSENKDNTINQELTRGGFQYVLCVEHSQNIFYCNCGMDLTDQMVYCDCCLEWYHTSCASFKNRGSETFICPFCTSWFHLKDKIIKQIYSNSNRPDTYDLKIVKSPKMYIPDFILLAIICDMRLTKASEIGANVSKIIKTIEYYPLKSSRIPHEQKKVQVVDNVNFEEIDEWINNKDNLKLNMVQVRHVQELWDNFDSETKSSQKYIKTRINYLTTWTSIIKSPPQNLSICYTKIKGLLYQYYQILRKYMMVSSTIIKTLKQPILFLEGLLEKLIPIVARLNKVSNQNQINDFEDTVDGVDISQLLTQTKVFLKTRKLLVLEVKIRKPYADLNRFYQDYRKISQSLLSQKILFKEEREKKEEAKRSLPTFEKSNMDKAQELKKKLKLDNSPILEKKLQRTNSMPNTVTEEDRATIQKILYNRMLQNPQFNNTKAQEFVKVIQNQIFGEFHKNRNKYMFLSDSFQMVFITLEDCPLISAKAKKKNFEYMFMKELVDDISRIKEFEEKLRLKQKEQHGETKTSSQTIIPLPTIDPKNDVMKSIITGKIQEKLQKQLQEIYALKREAERQKNERYYRGGDRYKRQKDRNYRRSRSKDKDKRKKRSESIHKDDQEAKFSDDESQQKNDNHYDPLGGLGGSGDKQKQKQKEREVQRDYLEEQLQMKNRTSNQPILYDPEQDEKPLKQKQKEVQKGTIIKLKTLQFQLNLKRDDRIKFQGSMYTIEDHKKIKQLCDPGFQKLSIKKQKPEDQILQYLSKTSRKKYRFLIGWLQSQNLGNNQYFRDLAIECEQRHKVFGLQNDIAKIHIMSSKQLNRQMVNKFRAPPRVTTPEVAKYLNEHRMVFVLQFSIQKLYESTQLLPFSITPVNSFAEVMSEPAYNHTVNSHHMTSTMMPYGIDMMQTVMMTNNPINFRNQVFIDGWDAQPTQPQLKIRKEFSPITSQDQGMQVEDDRKQPHHVVKNQNQGQNQNSSSGFDIMEILGKLDQSDISKLTQQTPKPIPQHHQSTHHQPSMYPSMVPPPPPQPQRASQPSSYLYQQHRVPVMNNPMMQRGPMGMQMPHQQYHPGYVSSHQSHPGMRGIPPQGMAPQSMAPQSMPPQSMAQQRYMMPNPGQGYYQGHMPPPPSSHYPPRE